jgi:phosphate/sulfate permease
MEVVLAIGGLGMIGAGAYMRAGRKNKGRVPILLIVFGIVAFLASFLMLISWRRPVAPAPAPVPAGVKNAVQKINAYVNNPSNMAKVALTVPMTGPPKVVVNPA